MYMDIDKKKQSYIIDKKELRYSIDGSLNSYYSSYHWVEATKLN